MSKIVYFVIGVDLDSKEPFIDDDVLVARFSKDEQIYNTDTEEWEGDDDDSTAYLEALEILNTVPLAKE
jgi:hypothetical protein